jgi:hypothetical protein
MEHQEPVPYENPIIVDHGDFADLTQHQMEGDHPLDFPFHGGDPHLTSSIG